MGGWNPPSFGPNPNSNFQGWTGHMGSVSTPYISSVYPSSTITFLVNSYFMENPPPTYYITLRWDQFSNIRNPLHKVNSLGGSGYPHMDNPYHITFSSQAFPYGMKPSQPFISPTYSIHVGDRSKTSASHVEYLQLAIASHVGGTTLVTSSHTAQTSPTFASHVGDQLLAYASHAGIMSPTTASHAGGIDMIEKPTCIGHKPKFLCILHKGDNLTHLCFAVAVV
jgi:hypothetical protein